MRDTSLEAYKDIQPTLGEKQRVVFEAIKELGTPTDLEVANYLGYSDPNSVRPRRNELMKANLIVEHEKRPCSISKRTVWSWKINVNKNKNTN